MKKVICFGTFDVLHLGHLDYFRQAKKYGDYLVVVIARDKTKKFQKKKIIFNEDERLRLVESLKIVDKARLGDVKDYFKVILEEKPDLICLGYDHKIDETELEKKLGIPVKRMKSYRPHLHKSTLLRKMIFNH